MWRKTHKDRRIEVLSKKDISGCRKSFIAQILREEAFMNRSGSNTELAHKITKCPTLCGDLHIPAIAKKARNDAGYILLNHDQSLIDYGFWEETTIPDVEVNLESMGENTLKKGVHAIHCHTGSGKTSNVLIPLAEGIPASDRALIVVPNVVTAKAIAKKLGWAHYHSQGTSAEDVVQAFTSFPKIVTCAASLRHLGDDYIPYQWIFIDEATEIMGYIQKERDAKKTDTHFHESLLKLYQAANYADRTYWFSADMPTGYTRRVLETLARESKRNAFYYRTLESYAKYHHYTQLTNIDELYVHCSRLLNDNKSVYFYTNASPRKGETKAIVETIKSMCPHATVELLDADVMNSAKGKEIEKEGIENYIVRRKLEEDVYCLVCSPVLQSQYSIVFEDENDAFDECLGWIKYAEICSPDGAAQGLDRMRQTKARTLVLEEYFKGKHSTYNDAWKASGIKELNYDEAHAFEKVYWETKIRQEQYRLVNLASRQWLFEIKCKQKEAKHSYDESFRISPKEKETLDKAKQKALGIEESRLKAFPINEHTERLKLLNRCLIFDEEANDWRALPRDTEDFTGLKESQCIDRETAERIFDICIMEPEERERMDKSFAEYYYSTCAEIFDRTLLDLINTTKLQKQMNFFNWYLRGDSTIYFELHESSETLNRKIRDSWDLIRRSLGLERGQYGTVTGFMPAIGNLIGLTISPALSDRDAKKMEWKKELFEQWGKVMPGKLAKKSVEDKYKIIAEALKEKLRKGETDFSEYDMRYLDTIKGVWKAKKHSTISTDIHSAYTVFSKKIGEELPESYSGVGIVSKPPESSINEDVELDILSEKS